MVDHSADITALRSTAKQLRALHTSEELTHLIAVKSAMYETAAALLEVHDATGISLDHWKGPRDLVELLIEHPIEENGV